MRKILDGRSSRIIYAFLTIHLIAYLALALIPAQALVPNIEFILTINSIFISFILFFSILIYKLYPSRAGMGKGRPMGLSQLNANALFSSWGALIGTVLIFYDRVFLRGIDYTQGLRVARYQWMASEGGNLPGVVGNILISLGYVCIFLLIIHYLSFTKKVRLILLVSSIISVVGHAALNGGRSNVLMAIVMVVSTLLLREYRASRSNIFIIKKRSLLVIPILIGGVFYISVINSSSADLGGFSMRTLTELDINNLYGQVTSGYDVIEELSDKLYHFIYVIAYLFHGQWTAQAAYSLSSHIGSYLLYPYGIILAKLGILAAPIEPGAFSDTGAFISLPGALYYDFGFFGIVVGAAIIGCLLGLALAFISYSKTLGGLKLAFIYYILFLILLSPVLPAYGFADLDFIAFIFTVVGIANRLIYGKNNWLNINVTHIG